MRRHASLVVVCSLVIGLGVGHSRAASPTVVVYDDFSAPGGYTLANYNAKWSNIYGMGDMGAYCADGVTPAHGDTRSFADGTLYIDDAPFTCGADYSVYDHLKYIAVSTQAFAVPKNGSLTFASDISADTPNAVGGHVVYGTYGPPGSYPNGAPYSAALLQGQQAGAVMNMINFATGQLFDWFISGNTAFALIERLPSSVTGNTTDPTSPDWVGPNKMYTQIIAEVPIAPGMHHVEIKLTRTSADAAVEYTLDGVRVAKVKQVGVPLDAQKVAYTGIYPSFGPGEDLHAKLDSFVFGHGTFSLLDAFPFQWGWSSSGCDPSWPAACNASVSIPLSQRLFGQGVRAHFDNFVAKTAQGS